MKLVKSAKSVRKVAKKTVAPVAAKAVVPPARAVTTEQVTQLAAPKPTKTASPVTTIEARIDVGFGNNLFVRGQGAGLSWDQGKPLICVDGKTWRWSAEASGKLTFKLLLNDQVWAQGADLVAKPGDRVEITPAF